MNNPEQIQMPTAAITAAGVVSSQAPAIELPGYELESLLGTGGYGEVWKAIGPGGLKKAVKILYGQRDSEQAAAELKALNRMRELRHPFLLSIERIEVCNNRLIVVTELADGNLNDRYDQYREKGQPGIPREELLRHLSDAADALDFLYEVHGLQHLDIKPDNLLLQGNRVKLGDFGLAKDVSLTNVSMINGFTPLFSAPELFEGRPGRSSDQYSLAIVYQVMLTGKTPFNGRTAAQLTSQHLRSQPDLSSLSPTDRPVIARALSKTAHARYPSCRDLVEELSTRRQGNPGAVPVGRPFSFEHAAPVSGQSFDCGDTLALEGRRVPDAVDSKPVAVEPVSEEVSLRPAVFIGVGGLAGDVLRSLKSQWENSWDEPVPAWQILQIDTDVASLRRQSTVPQTTPLAESEIIPISLRTSKDYRSARSLDLSWLSRRWLFNIPRSRLVEGMRPLSRLALLDHLPEVIRRIQTTMNAVTEGDAIARTAETVSTPFESNEVDVYIVAATSGGTGSGAISDVAMLVRELSNEMPQVNVNVLGVLLHGTSLGQKISGLQEANTIACLKELRLQGTPGVGVKKGFHDRVDDMPPFDHMWLMHCGDNIGDQQYTRSTEETARFLLNASGTTASADMREWRRAANVSNLEPELRLLGMASVDGQVYLMAQAEADALAVTILDAWTGSRFGESGGSTSRILDLLTTLQLTDATISKRVLAELRGSTGRKIEKLAEEFYETIRMEAPEVCREIGSLLDHLSARMGSTTDEDSLIGELTKDLRTLLTRSVQQAEIQLRQLLFSLLEGPGGGATVSAAQALGLEQLRRTVTCCENLASEIRRAFTDFCSQATQGHLADVSHQELCRQYCVLAASAAIYDCFIAHTSAIRDELESIVEQIGTVRQRLKDVRPLLAGRSLTRREIPGPVFAEFRNQLASSPTFSLESVGEDDFEVAAFATRLRDLAAGFLLEAGNAGQNDQQPFPGNAWPVLKSCGGRRRVMACVPTKETSQDSWRKRMTDEFGECVVMRKSLDSRISVVCEIDSVGIDSILKHLLAHNPKAGEIASRIHTRTDVQW